MSAAPLPAAIDRVALFSTLNRSRVVPGGGGPIDRKLLALNPSFTRTFDSDDHRWTKLIRGGAYLLEPHWPGIKPRLVRPWALLFWLAPSGWEEMRQAFLDQLGPFYLVWPRLHENLWKRELVAHAGPRPGCAQRPR